MANLDVSPMIRALQYSPHEFELTAGWLHHGRSGHSFRFDANDQVEVSAVTPSTEHGFYPPFSVRAVRVDSSP